MAIRGAQRGTDQFVGTAQLLELESWLNLMIQRDFEDAGAKFSTTLHNSTRLVEKDIAQHVLMSVALRRLRGARTLRRMAVHLTTSDHETGVAFVLSHRSFSDTQELETTITGAPENSSSRNRASLVRLVEAMGGWLRACDLGTDEAHVLWLPEVKPTTPTGLSATDAATALW